MNRRICLSIKKREKVGAGKWMRELCEQGCTYYHRCQNRKEHDWKNKKGDR